MPAGAVSKFKYKNKISIKNLSVILMCPCLMICPKAIISSRKSQVLQCDVWDWDPGMGMQNDDFLGRSVFAITCAWSH